ncbi:MAG: hypothetical protein LH624_05010, partial [Cryobacterium sp.]|nr:hypothetical protein [Cryobacterium sp.]
LTDSSETAKVARIREIREAGFEPGVEILAFGLDETTAFKVEAAAIDLVGFDNLTNLVVGHGAKRFGRMGIDEVHGKLSSKPIEAFDDDCVLIRINDSYADTAKQTAMDLYDATRGTWRVSLASANRARYALAVYGGTVREVYKVAAWLQSESTMYSDASRDNESNGRYEFVGRVAPPEVRARYRWKSVAHLFARGAANPIMYVGPHRSQMQPEPPVFAEPPVRYARPTPRPLDDTIIVAARAGYPEYLAHAAYVCQPDRFFRDGVTHLGFYANSEIKSEIAEILYAEESVIFTPEEASVRMSSVHPHVARVGRIIRELLADGSRTEGEAHKVVLLSSAEEDATVRLSRPVRNDKVTAAGRPWGWTLGQRYTSLAALRRGPGLTSELDSHGDELS